MAEAGRDRGTENEPSGAAGRGWTVWTLARLAVAVVAVLLGIVWTVRVALAGAASPAVLLRLLPPLALIYLGVFFAQSVIDAERQ